MPKLRRATASDRILASARAMLDELEAAELQMVDLVLDEFASDEPSPRQVRGSIDPAMTVLTAADRALLRAETSLIVLLREGIETAMRAIQYELEQIEATIARRYEGAASDAVRRTRETVDDIARSVARTARRSITDTGSSLLLRARIALANDRDTDPWEILVGTDRTGIYWSTARGLGLAARAAMIEATNVVRERAMGEFNASTAERDV